LLIAAVLVTSAPRPAAAADADTTAPVVLDVQASTTSIDVTDTTQTVVLTVRVSDAGTGVASVHGNWVPPTNVWHSLYFQLVSGSASDGSWRATMEVPRSSVPGDYDLYIGATDQVGNTSTMEAQQLIDRGWPGRIRVVNADPDVVAPRVTGFRLSPAAVDVRNGPADTTIEVDVSDAKTGTVQVAAAPLLSGGGGRDGIALSLVSGTAQAGTWRGTVTIPPFVRSGDWYFLISAYDGAMNQTQFLERDHQAAGWPYVLHVTSNPDTTPPTLLGLEVGRSSVDVSRAAQSIEITVHAADAEAGLADSMLVTMADTDGYYFLATSSMPITGGSRYDGTFKGTITVPASSPSGPRLLEVWGRDLVGNSFHVLSCELAALGLPSTIEVTGTTPGTAPPRSCAPPPSAPTPRAPSGGYWTLLASGDVAAFGPVAAFGGNRSARPFVDIAARPRGDGYWTATDRGEVYTAGAANWFGNAPSLGPGESVTSISGTRSGEGYWLFTNHGRVVPFGDATWFGDIAGARLNGPVLDAVATPTGAGYYLVASDGGVFTFGDARFSGSMGDQRLNAPVRSLVPDVDGDGYWLVAEDGGVFTFDAMFLGSMGGVPLNKPVRGMVASSSGRGYLMVATDGGIFSFGDAEFFGSLGGSPPASPVVSVAVSP
jgi:hypothetical protein